MFLRLLLLLLIALNIGVAGWLAFGHDGPSPPPPTDPGVAELRLLSERAGAPRAARPAAPSTQARAALASGQCLRIGPFTNQADTRKAMDGLRPHVARIQLRQDEVTRSTGWWVFLPAFPTREQALDAARALSASGVLDYYVITAGDRQNTVSLGLFHDPDNARRRLAHVRQLGFEARLTERHERLPEYWVDFMRPTTAGFDWHAHVDNPAVQASATDCS